jgi:hypothetical protein
VNQQFSGPAYRVCYRLGGSTGGVGSEQNVYICPAGKVLTTTGKLFNDGETLRLRGPCGAQFEFTLAAIAQNLRRLAKFARPPPLPASCVA